MFLEATAATTPTDGVPVSGTAHLATSPGSALGGPAGEAPGLLLQSQKPSTPATKLMKRSTASTHAARKNASSPVAA